MQSVIFEAEFYVLNLKEGWICTNHMHNVAKTEFMKEISSTLLPIEFESVSALFFRQCFDISRRNAGFNGRSGPLRTFNSLII